MYAKSCAVCYPRVPYDYNSRGLEETGKGEENLRFEWRMHRKADLSFARSLPLLESGRPEPPYYYLNSQGGK